MNMWESIGNNCLKHANALLERDDYLEELTAIERLVAIAVRIDTLNLHWESQSRSFSGVSRGRTLEPQLTRNSVETCVESTETPDH